MSDIELNSGSREVIELDANKLPSALELCFKAMGGMSEDNRTFELTGSDGAVWSFVFTGDLDYSGWIDNGVPLKKKGGVKLKELPETFLYQGTVDGLDAELSIYPEMDGDPAENFLVINHNSEA